MVRELAVEGPVVAKARPRFTRAGGIYTPTQSRAAETAIADAYILSGQGVIPRPRPVLLAVTAVLQRPKSHYRTARGHEDELKPDAPVVPTKAPDLDNLVKTVKDALNGVAWEDDSQVTTLIATKEYGQTSFWRISVMYDDHHSVYERGGPYDMGSARDVLTSEDIAWMKRPQRFWCQICDKPFPAPSFLEEHMREAHPEKAE